MSVQSWLNRIWYERPAPPWWMRPLSLCYGAAARSRRYLYVKRLRKSTRVASPVIVVGNLSVGGTGKTPLVCWLVTRLTDLGFKPGVVTRGYGGSVKNARLVGKLSSLATGWSGLLPLMQKLGMVGATLDMALFADFNASEALAFPFIADSIAVPIASEMSQGYPGSCLPYGTTFVEMIFMNGSELAFLSFARAASTDVRTVYFE